MAHTHDEPRRSPAALVKVAASRIGVKLAAQVVAVQALAPSNALDVPELVACRVAAASVKARQPLRHTVELAGIPVTLLERPVRETLLALGGVSCTGLMLATGLVSLAAGDMAQRRHTAAARAARPLQESNEIPALAVNVATAADLRPSALDDFSPSAALSSSASSLSERHGIFVHLQVMGPPDRLPPRWKR